MKLTKQYTILLVTFSLFGNSAHAQKPKYSDEVQARIQQVENHLGGRIKITGDKDWNIQERMKHYNVHGLTMAVVRNFQIEWAKAYGWADTAQHRPVTTETRFLAGSISKSLNAVGVLSLVQDKKIDLQQDVNMYLSTWKFPYDTVSKGKKITTANLLSHTAGLSIHGFPGYEVGTSIPSITQILDGQKPANTQAVRSLFEPGLKFKYSGGGTTISQLIVSDVSKKPYDRFMWDRVLKPMGMSNSSYSQPNTANETLATGYHGDGKELKGKYHIYPEQAAAGLWTTPTDLCRYIIETQLAYIGKSAKVLSQETTRLRLTPYVDKSAALGVFIVKKGTFTYFNHGGADAGFLSTYYGSLTDGNGVVVMVNSDNGSILDEVVNSVANVYNWDGFYQPIVKNVVDVPAAILDIYTGDYEMAPNFILTVTREQNQLISQATGQSKFALYAETETTFFPKDFEAQIEFVKDETGKVTKATLTQNGHKSEAKKIR